MTQEATGVMGRALRGSALTAMAYVVTQGLRLASNLILTRLLFPEAFGLMALVSVVLVGLQMFSDTGIGPAISRSPRGDDPQFLNTAWTVNVGRGALLWLLCCALAWPMAALWEADALRQLLPVAGLTLLISGFNPTRIDTANRHLVLGRLTALDLIAQAFGILAMVVLAALWPSVWALVWGALLGSAAKLVLCWFGLPGAANRFHWEPRAAQELLHFGKWILLSTVCGFLLAQGDKAILGRYLSLEDLGIYNVGYFLASFPALLARSVVARVMIPLYRNKAEGDGRLRKARWAVTAGVLLALAGLALIGEPLVRLLYDERYLAAGLIVTAVALAEMPGIIGMTYDQSALAEGDGRGYFTLIAQRALAQTLAFLLGAELGGLGGAFLGLGLSGLVTLPLIARLAHRHGVWDMRHDLAMLGLMAVLMLLVLSVTGPALLGLFNF
ncbi:oligosaccharide flippase family protein [Xinfangfangia sp. CPCC 101601]|uniref:Oligosaccharide flippase family protein n=1 Tax=Pseudogemmobacter lacusdianii TaxID=3069608 RepID=A0ABU0VWV7_9RHOB|nr:oligosaccharide flippase family protein [Xinfangfangia sp. CPCC 101601]MDQ2066241.1 oligosaccharide flippase family protein [Xinfangfangia sp. CPCC 101601]